MPARTRHAAMADHEALLDALKALTAERNEERRLRLAAESRLNASSAASARTLDQERRLRLAAESRLNASLAASARTLDQEHRLRLVAESWLSASARTLDEERGLRLTAESHLNASLAASARTLDQERRLRLVAESRLSASSVASARTLDQERLRRSHAPGRGRLAVETQVSAAARTLQAEAAPTSSMLSSGLHGISAPSTPLLSDRVRAVMAPFEALTARSSLSSVNGSQSAFLSSKKDSHIADREIEVQALQDKLDALLAAGLDAGAAHSKALSDRDSEIASLRARVVELKGRVDELVKDKEHMGTTEDLKEKAPYVAKAEKLKAEYANKIHAYNNPQAGAQEAAGDSDKSKSEINDEEGGGSENDE